MSDESPKAEESTPKGTSEGSFEAPGSPEVAFRVMHLDSVLFDLTDPSPTAHLLEAESPFRYLVIPLALSDAIALQHAHGAIESRRPSTHELMTTILTRMHAEVIAARIVRYEVIDCRTSDALSMALRQRVPAPILCSEDVLESYFV